MTSPSLFNRSWKSAFRPTLNRKTKINSLFAKLCTIVERVKEGNLQNWFVRHMSDLCSRPSCLRLKVITECIHLFRLTFDCLAALSRSRMITGSTPGGQLQPFGSAGMQNGQLL
jgi:hypothetical protein